MKSFTQSQRGLQRLWSILFLMVISGGTLIASGCGSSVPILKIESTEKTNGGRPFYVTLRFMDEQDFLTTTYQGVTAKMFQKSPKPDPNLVATELIYPGKAKQIAIKVPREQKYPVAIFFVFLNYGERWKTILPKPVPEYTTIKLEGNEIKSQQ